MISLELGCWEYFIKIPLLGQPKVGGLRKGVLIDEAQKLGTLFSEVSYCLTEARFPFFFMHTYIMW